MAKSNPAGKKKRIRKSAPTLRERVEAAKLSDGKPKVRRYKVVGSKAAAPLRRLRLRDRKAVKLLARIFRPVKKVLAWLVPSYFINSWREVRQVQWPNRRETWRLTLAVFIFAIIFGSLVAGVDKVLDDVFKKVILK